MDKNKTKIAKVFFHDRYQREFVLGQDGNQKTAVTHSFDCLATSPCGFGDTEKEAVSDLCRQLGLKPYEIIIGEADGQKP